MSNMIPWQTFKNRRRVDLKNLVAANNLGSYDQLVSFLAENFIGPPSLEEYEGAVDVPAPAKTAPAKKTSTRRTATKSTAQKVVAEDVEKVWQDGVEGSYESGATPQSKKPPAKKRATTRKRTTTRKKKA